MLVCNRHVRLVFLCFFFITLRSTYTPFYNALFYVGFSRRGREDPGSSPGVHFLLEFDRSEHTPIFVGLLLISEVCQTFSRFDVARQLPQDCLFFVQRFFMHSFWGWGDRLSTTPPPPKSRGFICDRSASALEGEGVHADPLPHSHCEYICDVSVFFGGGGTALIFR